MNRLAPLAVLGLVLAGCYTLQPARTGSPEVGARVALTLNDAGRVALGNTVGPGIDQIEGHLLETDGGEYRVAVSTVRPLVGGEQIWGGEQIRIKPEHVGLVYERRFSRGRTIALGAGIVGGVVAFVISRDLLGLGSGDSDRNRPDTAQTRIVRP